MIVSISMYRRACMFLAYIMGLEVDNNDFDELVEEHSQMLTTDEQMELHCVSQQEGGVESLSEEEEDVTTKQQSSGEIREMLKTWETVEKHHPNKAVAMRATKIYLMIMQCRIFTKF
ncbi:hypothetical protein CBL_20453 [Carabus blaptoides fortunei]